MTLEPHSHSGVKALYWSGIVLLASGIMHLPVWLIEGEPWEGSVSWRKPILFGISTGLTLWSLGWLVNALKQSKMDKIFSWLTALSLVVEVGLISLQQWLGEASHFNRSSPLNASIDTAMIVFITLAVVGIVYFTVRSFSNLGLSRDNQIAIRCGMLFLVGSCLIGYIISQHGYEQIANGMSPEKVGDKGVAKFPHGIAIHALQLLPLMAFCLRKLGVKEMTRATLVYSASCSFVLQVVFACYQTWNGLGRFELWTVTGSTLFIASVAAFGIPIAILLGKPALDQRKQTI